MAAERVVSIMGHGGRPLFFPAWYEKHTAGDAGSHRMKTHESATGRVAIGIPGLDYILRGGLVKDRIYLVHGGPGTGKTTLCMQFLLQGVRKAERVLYLTLLQSRTELIHMMASHGWSMDGI